MREDVLQADQPHQNFLVRLLGKRVSDDVELYDAPPLLQPGSLVTGSIWRQQIGLAIRTKRVTHFNKNVTKIRDASFPSDCLTHLWSEHSSGVGDRHHDFVDQLHRNVSHHADPLGILQGQRLRNFPLLS